MRRSEERNEPIEVYLASQAISASDCKNILRSPAHYLAFKSGNRRSTPAQEFGTLMHKALLEPAHYCPVVAPQVDRRTKEGKHAWTEFLRDSDGLDIVTVEDKATIESILASVAKCIDAQALLKSGVAERSLYTEHDGTPVRCRPDWRCDRRKMILNLKTSEDASPEEFSKAVARYSYHIQAAMEISCAAALWDCDPRDIGYHWLVVEKGEPFAVSVFQPDPHMLAVGHRLLGDALRIYRDASERNAFEVSKYRRGEITLPRWAWEV